MNETFSSAFLSGFYKENRKNAIEMKQWHLKAPHSWSHTSDNDEEEQKESLRATTMGRGNRVGWRPTSRAFRRRI